MSSVALAGCRGGPPPKPLPRFSDIAPRHAFLQPPDEPLGSGRAPATVVVHRLEVPRAMTHRGQLATHPEIISLWSRLDTEGIDPATVARWRANGLRVGFLDAAQADALNPLAQRSVLRGGTHSLAAATAMTLETFPHLPDPPPFELTLPEGPGWEQPRPGRFQFIINFIPRRPAEPPADANAAPDAGSPPAAADAAPAELPPWDGDLDLQLTPHHYFARPTLLPLPVEEQAFQGRIFVDLALSTVLRPQRLLVITMERAPRPAPPEAPPAEQPNEADVAAPHGAAQQEREQPGGTSADPAAAAAEGAAEPPEAPEPAPLRLGDLLLTGYRFGTPIEVVLVIVAPPVEP